jgi:hypothetical protein
MTLSRPGALLALTLLMIAASIVTGVLGPRKAEGLPSGFSRPILALEFVESPEQFETIVGEPEGGLSQRIFRATLADLILIAVYCLLWWAWLSRIDGSAKRPWRWWVTIGRVGIVVAAGADLVENYGILRGLESNAPQADLIRMAAIVKWAALGTAHLVLATGFARPWRELKGHRAARYAYAALVLTYATAGLLAIIGLMVHRPWIEFVPWPIAVALLAQIPVAIAAMRRQAPPQPRQADFTESIDEVRKRELEYIAGRRADAGLPPCEVVANTLVGLSLSGGGIRSATTNLGILQALSRMGILPKADYLSTVSGGGYIGSCLSALLSLKSGADPGAADQFDYRARTALRFTTRWQSFPFNPDLAPTVGRCCEPTATPTDAKHVVSHLRTHGNFLIARRGLLKRDALRAAGHLLTSTLYNLLTTAAVLFLIALFFMALAHLIEPDLFETLRPPTAATVTEVVRVRPATASALPEYAITKREDASARQAIGGRVDAIWEGMKIDLANRSLIRAAVIGALTSLVIFAFFVVAVRQQKWPKRWGAGESKEDRFSRYTLNAAACGLIAALLLVWMFVHRTDGDQGAGWIALPFFVLVGARIAAFVVYVAIARLEIANWPSLRCWTREFRSLWGAFQAMTTYGMVMTLAFVALPVLAYAATDVSPWSGLAPVGSLVVSRLLVTAAARQTAGKLRIPTGLLHFVLGLAVTLVIGLGIVGLAAVAVDYNFARFGGTHPNRLITAFAIGFVAVAMLSVLGDINRISPHYFYRDRLLETYLRIERPRADKSMETFSDASEMALTELHGTDPQPGVPGLGNTAPYMLISAAINLSGSRDLTRKDRKSGYFLFSKYYCGSRQTGYRKTETWRGGETKLSRAMTVSGAAVSSAMGMNTFFAEAFVTAMFNLRLGYWMSNPRWNQSDRAVFWPRYMFQEMFARTNERRPLVNLSDGGHTGDNVGIYPLLERRCQVIIACDAEADRGLSFGSFTEALRHAYVDLGVDVDIDLSMIRPDPQTGLSKNHCAIGRIRYPECPDRPNWLIYLKNSMTGDEPAPVMNYKTTCLDFPHESTADQFFDDGQFESYRALGVHIAEKSLGWWVERADVAAALDNPGL